MKRGMSTTWKKGRRRSRPVRPDRGVTGELDAGGRKFWYRPQRGCLTKEGKRGESGLGKEKGRHPLPPRKGEYACQEENVEKTNTIMSSSKRGVEWGGESGKVSKGGKSELVPTRKGDRSRNEGTKGGKATQDEK